MKRFTFILLCWYLYTLSAVGQTIWYVDADATGPETGTSWAEAFRDLQAALAVAEDGDQIWVAEGVYRPDSVDRFASFEVKNGVQVYGGFGGWESSLDERDWETHLTVLSGEIGDPQDSTDNSFTVVYMKDVDSTTLIDGFVIRDGYADKDYAPWTRYGGGMYLDGRDGGYVYAHVRHCVFEHNYGRVGGGLMIDGSNYGSVAPRIEQCTFRGNAAYLGGGACRSGGSFVERYGDFVKCSFYDNYAYQGAAGLYYYEGSGMDRFELVSCDFVGNRSWVSAGVSLQWWGARLEETSRFLMDSCLVEGEVVEGASQDLTKDVFVLGSLSAAIREIEVKNTVFRSDAQTSFYVDNLPSVYDNITEIALTNSLWDSSSVQRAFSLAGAAYIRVDGVEVLMDSAFFGQFVFIVGGNIAISNSIFRVNLDEVIGRPFYFFISYYLESLVEDSIVFKNVLFALEDTVSLLSDESFIEYKSSLGHFDTLIFINCFFPRGVEGRLFSSSSEDFLKVYNSVVPSLGDPVEGTVVFANCYVSDTAGASGWIDWQGENVIGVDGGFVDWAGGDYRLSACSPLRDAGDTDVVYAFGLSRDLDGGTRVQGADVDIGPYEHAALRLELDSVGGVASCASEEVSVWVRVFEGCAPWRVWPVGGQDTVWGDSPSALQLWLGGGAHELVLEDGSGLRDTLWVTVPVEPLELELSSEPVVCPGQGGAVEVLGVSGSTPPLSYAWSTGDTSAGVAGLGAGWYVVTVTDGWGCESVDSVWVGVEGTLPLALSTEPVSCYGYSDGVLSVAGVGAVWPQTWQWSDGSEDSLRTDLSAGAYGVTVTDGLGCWGSLTAVLVEPDSLEVRIEGDTLLCAGSLVALQGEVSGGTPPYVWYWSTGQAGADLEVMEGGFYGVTVWDAQGCEAVSGLTLTEVSMPTVTWEVDSATGAGVSDGRIELVVEGEWGPYEAMWSTGSTGWVLDSVAGGMYEVTLTDAGGCTYVYEIEVPSGGVTAYAEEGLDRVFLSIQPNPSGGEGARLRVGGLWGKYEVRVCDAWGRVLWRGEGAGAELGLPPMAAGVYRVEVEGRAGRGQIPWVVLE